MPSTSDDARGLQYESIGQTGRRMSRALLGQNLYGGVAPDRYFGRAYDLRSAIVHRGRPDGSCDMFQEANTLQEFVGDLLQASIGLPPFPSLSRAAANTSAQPTREGSAKVGGGGSA